MNVRIKKYKNGSSIWQGWYFFAGVRYWESLGPVQGRQPDMVFPEGDSEYQMSKAQALVELKKRAQLFTDQHRSREEFDRLQSVIASKVLKRKYKTGTDSCCPLSSLESRLQELIQEQCCEMHLKRVLKIVQGFVQYVHTAGNLENVTEDQVRSYLQSVDAMHPTARTYNEYLRQLKRVFREFCAFGDTKKFVDSLPKREESDSMTREIFTSEEIAEIIDQAKKMDPDIASMVIIASCTGLRLKDICLLTWGSVNFRRNLITLSTYKTGGSVTLGMWPMLREELQRLESVDTHSEYVMPLVAKQYLKNPDPLLVRLRKVLYSLNYKKDEIFKRSSARIYSASLRGWHSFRGSFVVAALRSGVSMEVLQKVLGAKTVEVLYQHYIHIDDGFMQASFTSKAPDFARSRKT